MKTMTREIKASGVMAALTMLLITSSAYGQVIEKDKTKPESVKKPDSEHQITWGEKSFLNIHGLVQGQFIASFDDNSAYVNLGDRRSTFRLRRAELAFSGGLGDKIGFVIMFDPTKVMEFRSESISIPDQNSTDTQVEVMQPQSAISILHDFNITFKYIPNLNFTFGQGLTPITYDGLFPSGDMIFAERSELGSTFGDQRDIGLWAHYDFGKFSYKLGIYNGEGPNLLDSDKYKDIALRLTVSPAKWLSIGASGQRTLTGNSNKTHTVAGGDIAFQAAGFTANLEFYWRRLTSGTEGINDNNSMGVYGALAYLFESSIGGWQLAIRYDLFDPDTDNDEDNYWRFTGGLNYLFPQKGARLILNYIHTNQSLSAPNVDDWVEMNNNMLIIEAQFAF